MLQKLLIFFAVVKETMCVVLLFLYSSPDCPVTCCVDQAGELKRSPSVPLECGEIKGVRQHHPTKV